jgi:hypothetical protein
MRPSTIRKRREGFRSRPFVRVGKTLVVGRAAPPPNPKHGGPAADGGETFQVGAHTGDALTDRAAPIAEPVRGPR